MHRIILGLIIGTIVLGIGVTAVPAEARYLLKNHLNTVQVKKAPSKVLKHNKLNHSFDFSPQTLKEILMSIRFSKSFMILKDVDNAPLFPERDADVLVPYLVSAFSQATSDEVIFFSYVVKNTKFVVRNDRLTICRAYIVGDELHLEFRKLYAKLLGDYAKTNEQRLINKSKGLRVALEPTKGQYLSPSDDKTLVIRLDQDYAPIVKERDKRDKEQVEAAKHKTGNEEDIPLPTEVQNKPHSQEKPADSMLSGFEDSSVKERLQVLKQLKDEELITEKEYKRKKKELLKDL
jgi:hypothetical protein